LLLSLLLLQQSAAFNGMKLPIYFIELAPSPNLSLIIFVMLSDVKPYNLT